MHHLDSRTKTGQLDVICFIISLFTAQNVSNVSTSIFRSLRLVVDLFRVLYFSGSMCVGVTLWFGWRWCGILMQAEALLVLLLYYYSSMTAALEGGQWSAARLGSNLTPEKNRYPFYRGLGGPQGRFGREKNLVPTGIRSRTVQSLVSRYID